MSVDANGTQDRLLDTGLWSSLIGFITVILYELLRVYQLTVIIILIVE